MTRWRASDVAQFWAEFGERRAPGKAEAVDAQARKASAAAKSKRTAQAQR